MDGGISITHNRDQSRFQTEKNGSTAVLEYRQSPHAITFLHTEVPSPLQGQGVAGQLVRAGLDYARSEGLPAIPLCPFVAGYIQRHPEYKDLVPERFQNKRPV